MQNCTNVEIQKLTLQMGKKLSVEIYIHIGILIHKYTYIYTDTRLQIFHNKVISMHKTT